MSFLDIFSRKKTLEEEKIKIIVDIREKNSLIPSELIANGLEVEFRHLEVGDYIVKNVVIERKTISDFLSSMINKRLFEQLESIKNIQKKILIIEGIEEQELYYEKSGINENAIRGFILTILLTYNIPIIFTKNYEDSAKFIKVLAKKQENEKEWGINAKRKSRDVNEQMQFIIEGFPGIGPKSAKKLLNEFKTIKNIINAPEEELKKILGKKSEIFKIIDKEYIEDNHD